MSWWRWITGKQPEKAPPAQIPLPKEDLPPRVLEVVKAQPVVMASPKEPRGIRNHNPGNIRHGAKWQGMADVQSDAAFVTFKSPEWGIRAMARILLNYQANYGLHTVRGIIHRWAPPTGKDPATGRAYTQDTDAYVMQVAKALGVDPDQQIDVWARLPQLIPAIIKHENGKQPYSDAVINEGIKLA